MSYDDPRDQKTFCVVCDSWRYSPISCGRDDCGRPETATMQQEVRKALAATRPREIEAQRDELLAAAKQARREYGAFGRLSGETLVQIDAAVRRAEGQ